MAIVSIFLGLTIVIIISLCLLGAAYIDEDENEILELSSTKTFLVMLKIPEECVTEEELLNLLTKRLTDAYSSSPSLSRYFTSIEAVNFRMKPCLWLTAALHRVLEMRKMHSMLQKRFRELPQKYLAGTAVAEIGRCPICTVTQPGSLPSKPSPAVLAGLCLEKARNRKPDGTGGGLGGWTVQCEVPAALKQQIPPPTCGHFPFGERTLLCSAWGATANLCWWRRQQG
ncbi:TPA-induced transmembrane protein isoform X3 [Tamandua tetradactyla]